MKPWTTQIELKAITTTSTCWKPSRTYYPQISKVTFSNEKHNSYLILAYLLPPPPEGGFVWNEKISLFISMRSLMLKFAGAGVPTDGLRPRKPKRPQWERSKFMSNSLWKIIQVHRILMAPFVGLKLQTLIAFTLVSNTYTPWSAACTANQMKQNAFKDMKEINWTATRWHDSREARMAWPRT